MRISTSMRWLVVAVSAAMLLAVAAACSSETIEVPGETVVVEKEVIKTVEVPGETVVKEVIKEVQVPGETVVVKEEVVKEVMVPGETVVVEKVVTETVEVPGETVTVEVVKTVEVPGETVVVEKEVVKTVEVPGQTVVVEKEVVKTVEVPGQTVVVTKEVAGPERVVVKEVPGKKYVTDPSTGEVVTAPQYGGTITFPSHESPLGTDNLVGITGSNSPSLTDPVIEKLGMADWAAPRDKFDLSAVFPPAEYTRGQLAESWSQPDPLTVIVNVRQGVRWHDKTPMNGRELTAQDVEFNFHRLLGTGSGFTEPSETLTYGYMWPGVKVASVTATDESTVEFKLQEPALTILHAMLHENGSFIYPPEVIQEHGDANDWRNLVGTGPMMLTEWVEGSSWTWEKNPDYWGYDEKYPENRLPYVDRLRALAMKEQATILAAMRTGQIDLLPWISPLSSLDQVESLQKTNPGIRIWSGAGGSSHSVGLNVQVEPFDDIRVRKALQMAINLEEINNAYYKGYADIIPQGQLSRFVSEAVIQFEDWPEDVKKVFDYDPEAAEALLDEAGYERGEDGVRFETDIMHYHVRDLNYTQLLLSYWKKIGIDVEIDVQDRAGFGPRRASADFRMMMAGESAGKTSALGWAGGIRYLAETQWNSSNVNDPWYEAKYKEKRAATMMEEANSITKELNQYAIEQFWTLFSPIVPSYVVSHPWVIGFNGESNLGQSRYQAVLARLWIDQELKAAMGH